MQQVKYGLSTLKKTTNEYIETKGAKGNGSIVLTKKNSVVKDCLDLPSKLMKKKKEAKSKNQER